MTPLLPALVGAAVVLAGALVARSATRYAAQLEAAQRRRDAELVSLREFRDVFAGALGRLSAFRYALTRIDAETPQPNRFDEANRFLEAVDGYGGFRVETAEALERLRNLALCLPWTDLRDAFDPLDRVLHGATRPLEAAALIEQDASLIDDFVRLLAERHRGLLEGYPTRPTRAGRVRRRRRSRCAAR